MVIMDSIRYHPQLVTAFGDHIGLVRYRINIHTERLASQRYVVTNAVVGAIDNGHRIRSGIGDEDMAGGLGLHPERPERHYRR